MKSWRGGGLDGLALIDLGEDDDAGEFGVWVAWDRGVEDEYALTDMVSLFYSSTSSSVAEDIIVRWREWRSSRTHGPVSVCFCGHIFVEFLDQHDDGLYFVLAADASALIWLPQ